VFGAVRAAWPADRPVSVRISPAQWYPSGEDAGPVIAIADAFAARGAAAVHVSTGMQAGRSAYADRIRNQAGREIAFAVIESGSISMPDVDVIVLAGRADLCVVDRLPENSLWLSPPRTPDRPAPQKWP
jgi:anthraniloyl-CoA monooxygenase